MSALPSRDLGGILGEAFRVYVRNFWHLLAMVAIVEVGLAVLSQAVPLAMFGSVVVVRDWTWIGTVGVMLIVWAVVVLVATLVLYPFMEGAVIHATAEQHFAALGVGRSYRFAWKRIGALVGASVLVALFMLAIVVAAGLAGFALTVALGGIGIALSVLLGLGALVATLYFSVRWAFIWQAVILDGRGARSALSRSDELVQGNWWRVLGILLVLWLIVMGVNVAVGLFTWWLPAIATSIVNTVVAIVVLPIPIVAATLLYYDLRLKREGCTVEAVAQDIGWVPVDGSA